MTVLNRIGSTEIIVNTLEFSDYAYFSKFFKSKMGMTPMEFRKTYFH
ncbi:AraC family transcriptional regulator [Maribacter stanieri]|nr:AraC family transcriptional regulator [Maribacter stanieri]